MGSHTSHSPFLKKVRHYFSSLLSLFDILALDMIPGNFYEDRKPDKEKEADTGNTGTEYTHWYYNTAILIWPTPAPVIAAPASAQSKVSGKLVASKKRKTHDDDD